jgi:predicted metalloendopeptidase
MLEGAGVPAGSSFVLGQPSYAAALAGLLAERPLTQWKDYLKARLLDDYAPYLSQDFVDASFDFHGRTLSGTPELRPRWKRAVTAVNRGMGFAVGREYVARHFPPEARTRMQVLVANLLAAMDRRIETLDWMSPATREQAHEKLRKVRVKIGYPDIWQGYQGLEVRADDLLGNVVRAAAFDWRRELERLAKPVDPTEWLMTPQTVNAYYMPTANEIAFPAAILQPPFFNFDAEEAVNYGAIGAAIGHEVSHGFDDKGRQYDGDGNLRDWWVAADDAAFRARTRKLVEQYGAFRPVPDAAVNGELTLGENIGDLSGLAIAWQAWQISLQGREAPVIDDMTGAQRFLFGFGQVWRAKQREASLRQQVLSDPHAPAEFRANGVVANFEPFYATFGVKQGDKLWRPAQERVTIW